MVDNDEIQELLLRAAGGDRDAFQTLYKRSAPYLLTLALRVVGRRALAEEVLQEGFVQIWYNARDFNVNKGCAMSWMAGVIRHRALDCRRSETSQRTKLEAAALEPEPEAEAGPERRSGYTADLQALLACLEGLKARHRECLLMAYYYGFSHQEMAQKFEQPLGTVKSWVRRGMIGVRECLQL